MPPTKRVLVEVIGDSSSLQRSFAKASASAEVMGANMKRQEKHLIQFSRGALIGSDALSGLTRAVVFASTAFVGAYGLTFAFKSSADAAKEFQSQMELVTTQAGATQKEVEKMSKALLRIAPSIGQTPEDLAKGLYHLESAGIRGTKALDALKSAARGAAVGHTDLESTVNALVGAFKSGISGAGGFGNTMATLSAIVGAGNIRLGDLNQALGTGILNSGRAFGLTLRDVGAALATLSIGSVPVVEAATRLRMSFSLLGSGSSVRADKALDKIGLSSRKLAVDLRSGGIVKAIGDLKDHLVGLSKVDATRVMTQAFGGGRYSTSIITLVQNFQLLKERMAQIRTGVSRFGESWVHTQQTAEFASKKLHAAVQVLQVEIGSVFLPQIAKTSQRFAEWIDKMNRTGQLQKEIKSTTQTVSSFMKMLGADFQAATPLVKSFIDAVGGAKHAIIGLGLLWIGLKTKVLSSLAASLKGIGSAVAATLTAGQKIGVAGSGLAAQQQKFAASQVSALSQVASAYGGVSAAASASAASQVSSMAVVTKAEAQMITNALAIQKMTTSIPAFGGGIMLRTAGGYSVASGRHWEPGFAGALTPSGPLLPQSPRPTTVVPLDARVAMNKEISAAAWAAVTSAQKGLLSAALTDAKIASNLGYQTIRPPENIYKPEVVSANYSRFPRLRAMGGAARGYGASAGAFVDSHALNLGLLAAFLGPAAADSLGAGPTAGKLVAGAGYGLALGSFLPGKYGALAGAGIGTGLALRKAIPGQGGQLAGNILTGASAGAAAGMAVGPEGAAIGAAVGAAAGLGFSLFKLSRHADSAARALENLAKRGPLVDTQISNARKGVAEARAIVAQGPLAIDQAKAQRDEAKAEEVATRGTSAHKVALDALRASEANYTRTVAGAREDQKALREQVLRLNTALKHQRVDLKSSADTFLDVANASLHAKDAIVQYGGRAAAVMQKTSANDALDAFISKMDKMSHDKKIGPHLRAVAAQLANIAAITRQMPGKKVINILLKYTITTKMGGSGSDRHNLLTDAVAAGKDTKKPVVVKPPKPAPPHDFVLPQSVLLMLAKASTQGTAAQLEADRAELKYIKAQIASGNLTKKGLIAAYTEEGQVMDDIAALIKKRDHKKKKKRPRQPTLSDILPASFVSDIQRAQAGVSVADASGNVVKQMAALERLQAAYQKTLTFLKGEHETGKKRLLQIKEEALLTSRIADVRKQIKDMIAQAVDSARGQIGTLFQGPVLSPTADQQKAILGVPKIGVGKLTDDVKAQTKLFINFNKALATLSKRGAPAELIKELRDMGVGATPMIQALAKSSKAQFAAFLKAFQAREKAVQKVARVMIHADMVNLKATHVSLHGNVPKGNTGTASHFHRTPPHHNTPKRYPKMADGGIVVQPTFALIGEKGPEAVIPLNKANMGGNTTIIVEMEGNEVARAVLPAQQRRASSTVVQVRGRHAGNKFGTI